MVYTADPVWLTALVFLVLILPFLAGIFGAVCLYRGFMGLASTICDAR